MASTDRICPLENVRNEPRDCTSPVAWSRQAFAPQFDLHPKTVLLITRELGVSGYSLNLWKKAYLKRMEPAQVGSTQMSPEQMVAEIKRQQKEIEYLRRLSFAVNSFSNAFWAGFCS